MTSTSQLPAASDAALAGLEQQAWRGFQRGDLCTAALVAERLTRLAPGRAWSFYLLAEIATRRAQWAAASAHFARCVELGRQDGETCVRAGEAHWRVGDVAAATRFFEMACRADDLPGARKALIRRAMAQMK